MISPEQILGLLPLIDADDSKIEKSKGLKKVIARLARTSTFVKLQDQLGDIHIRAMELCHTNPKYQGILAQKNCQHLVRRTRANMDILNFKRENEQRIRKVQEEVQQIVHHQLQNNTGNSLPQKGHTMGGKIALPWED